MDASLIPFQLTLAFLIVHEMDAVHRREWTIFPFLSRLDDRMGYILFTIAHIPLVFLVLAGLSNGAIFQPVVRVVVDIFCIAHIGLHWLFHQNPLNQFDNRFSRLIIFGCGLAGLIDLVLLIA